MNGSQRTVRWVAAASLHFLVFYHGWWCSKAHRIRTPRYIYVLPTIAVDFFNEVSLVWEIVRESRADSDPAYFSKIAVGSGFPRGFEYRWAGSGSDRQRQKSSKSPIPIRCSGPQYVEYVLSWIDERLNDDKCFPRSEGEVISVSNEPS
jgi:Mob1/phocein family